MALSGGHFFVYSQSFYDNISNISNIESSILLKQFRLLAILPLLIPIYTPVTQTSLANSIDKNLPNTVEPYLEVAHNSFVDRTPQVTALINDCKAQGGDYHDYGCHIPPPAPKPLTAVVQPSGSCFDWMQQAGISDVQTAYYLIMRESGCNPNAVNRYSGACGIGQQLPCGKWPHLWNDPVGAMIDTQNYVYATYGSWANALAFHYRNNWY